MTDLALISADPIPAPHVVRESLNPAQPRRPWSVQDLQDQFIAEEIRGRFRICLSAADHGGLEQHVIPEPCQLTVYLPRILFNGEQLLPKQSFSHRSRVVRPIPDQFAATVSQKTNLVHKRGIIGSGSA